MPSPKSQNRKLILSPTRISTYLDCAVKYKYVYQDKIGRFYTKARAGYSFGTTLHNVLQDFHEQGATQTVEQLTVQMQESWVSAGYQTPQQEQEHRELGEQVLKAYHTAHQERATAQVETFATEKTLTCDMGQFKLSGRVDRIDRHTDGTLEIIDYKSGRLTTTSQEVADSLAMSCYQLILRKLHPNTRVFATIYCLRSGNSASYCLENERLQEFEQDILILANEIIERDFTLLEPEPLEICEDCDFHRLCQRYWRGKEQAETFAMVDPPHFMD